MAEDYLEAVERAVEYKQLKGRAACRRLILKRELGGAGTAQLRKEALREPLLQPIMTVLRSSIVMLSHAGRRDYKPPRRFTTLTPT